MVYGLTSVFYCYCSGMSTYWFPLSLDARGSLNIPIDIKRRLGLGVNTNLVVREVNGVIVVVPLIGDALAAHTNNTLEVWVDGRLQTALPPAPVASSAVAVAEAVRTQRAREKHAMKMQEMDKQLEMYRAKREVMQETQRPPHQTAREAMLERARNAPASTQSVQEILAEMRGETEPSPLPQANLE